MIKHGAHRKATKMRLRTKVLAVLAMIGAVLFGSALAASAAHAPSVGKDAAGNYHDCVNQSAPYQEMRGNARDQCWAGWLPRDLAAAPSYGVAYVDVARGAGNPATWESLTTTLGSPAPMGDQASGTFRMTCSDVQAPCKISVRASVSAAGYSIYPRLDIQRQALDGGPQTYCEYADGADNDGGSQALTSTAVTVPLGIGGSLDCGSGQAYPAGGVVQEIDVPSGHYDITGTVFFKR